MKKTPRWLLPFTHAVDLRAIDLAIRVAAHSAATLVALSLLAPRSGQREQRIRLEQIQESKDFLEAVRWKARRHQVTVELHEVFTDDIPGTIAAQVHDLDCECILLMGRGGRMPRGSPDALLSGEEVKHLFLHPPASLLLLTLPVADERPPLGTRFLSWLCRFREPRSTLQTRQTDLTPVDQSARSAEEQPV